MRVFQIETKFTKSFSSYGSLSMIFFFYHIMLFELCIFFKPTCSFLFIHLILFLLHRVALQRVYPFRSKHITRRQKSFYVSWDFTSAVGMPKTITLHPLYDICKISPDIILFLLAF